MGDWFRRFHTFIIRLVLGDNEVAPFKPDKGLDPTVEAYGQCIAVLLASTQTYLEQRIESLAAGSVERLAAEQCQTKVVGLEKAFEDSSQPEAERFKSYVKIDAQLIAIIPDDFLVARRWILLDRMRRVAPQKALIEYEGSLPPSMDKAKRDLAKEIRADLLSLSTYMQQLYILNAQREQTLASFKWWLLSRVLVIVGIIAAIFWLATTVTPTWLSARPWSMPWMPTALILVFLTGMVGAVVSIIRKFQDIGGQNILVSDPFNELVSLNYSRESVAASIVVGGMFALVAYLAVVSGPPMRWV